MSPKQKKRGPNVSTKPGFASGPEEWRGQRGRYGVYLDHRWKINRRQHSLIPILAQQLLGLHPHDVDDAEGAGQQYAQDPGEIPHMSSRI